MDYKEFTAVRERIREQAARVSEFEAENKKQFERGLQEGEARQAILEIAAKDKFLEHLRGRCPVDMACRKGGARATVAIEDALRAELAALQAERSILLEAAKDAYDWIVNGDFWCDGPDDNDHHVMQSVKQALKACGVLDEDER